MPLLSERKCLFVLNITSSIMMNVVSFGPAKMVDNVLMNKEDTFAYVPMDLKVQSLQNVCK